jgi:thiamine kinase
VRTPNDQEPVPDARLLTRIGGGVSADVFLLPPDRVLKLLFPGLGKAMAAREFTAATLAFAASLPVPRPIGLTQQGDRHGIVFERLVEGKLTRQLRRMPGPVMLTWWSLARLQARSHAVIAGPGTLPAAYAVIAARCADASAPDDSRIEAARLLAALPPGDRLLHGDLHLGNVITAQGRLMAVDWAQAMIGDPAADVARTELLLRFGRYGPALRRHPWLRVARHAAAEWYLFCYRRVTGMAGAEIDAWRLPTAVAWMRPDSAAHLPSLAAYVEQRLSRAQLR